jgi:cell shape-determining protein MreD
MRFFFLHVLLGVGAYVCQSAIFPVFLAPALRVDLFLVLLLHASFSNEKYRAIVLALFFGLLMDVGLPVKGFYYPVIYLAIALVASLLWQNLNLHTRRYQALLLGLCTLFACGGMWVMLWLAGAKFAETHDMLQILAGRTVTIALVGPLLLVGLERLDQWFDTLTNLQESREA